MLRRFWFLLAFVIAGFAGYQASLGTPALIAWLSETIAGEAAAPALGGYVALVWAVTLATVVVFALIFIVFAVGDGLKVRHIMQGLEALREGRANGEEPSLRDFLAAFGDSEDLARLATDYGATLHAERPERAGRDARITYRATVPATAYFGQGSLVDARLYVWFFCRLPTALCVLGILGLAAGLVDGIGGLRAAASASALPALAWEPLASGAEGGLMALVLAAGFGLVIGVVQHLVLAARYQQNAELCHAIDALFRFGIEADYLRELASVTRGETEELRRALVNASDDLRATVRQGDERITAAIEAQAKATAAALGESVQAVLASPLTRLAEVAEASGRDQSVRVRELVEGTLAAFTAELGARFGDQLTEVNAVLVSSRAAAADIRDAFAAVAEGLTREVGRIGERFAAELGAALEAERGHIGEHDALLAKRLEEVTGLLARDVEAHSRHFDTLLKDALQRVEEITHSALYTSSEDLARTASAFSGLQAVVESLALSVTPILNQVVETQNRLLDAIGDEASGGRLIAGAAKDLNAAARASRETVEKFVVLATRLSDAGKRIHGSSPAREPVHETAPAEARGGGRRLGSEISRALVELREENGGGDELPEL